MYDFIVIGASIAGCSFALNISDNAKVLLLDKRDIFSHNLKDYKPCGGLISPDAQEELFRQGINIDSSFLIDPQLISVLNYDFDNKKDIYFSRFYFNIDRQKFDQMLLKKVLERHNCELKKERVLSYEEITESNVLESDAKGYLVKTDMGQYRTKKIIMAQGWNNSLVQKQCTNKMTLKEAYHNKYVVLQEWFDNTEAKVNTNIAIFDRSITDYYAWIIPKGDRFLLGLGIEREDTKDYKKIFLALKEKLIQKKIPLSHALLNKPIHTESCMLIRPKSRHDVYMGNSDVMIIGEAANLISPSSAEGYSYALKSGRLLAKGINENNLNLRKIEKYFKRNIQKKIIKKYIMFNPFLRNLVYKTKIFQINTK